MGRWTQYDDDEYRLPEGFKLAGYDADEQTYFFKDERGDLWSSKERYGVMKPVQRKKRMHTAHAEKARAQEGEEATESDDEKTLLDDSDEEFDDTESVAETLQADHQPRSLWTLFDDGDLSHAQAHQHHQRPTVDNNTSQSNAGFAFISPAHISPAEPLAESSSASRRFRNITRLIQGTSAFGGAVVDKVLSKAPSGVVDPDGSAQAYSEGKTLRDVDEEWEVLKRSATSASNGKRAAKDGGKSRRAFSVREPRGDKTAASASAFGHGSSSGHGKQRSEPGMSSMREVSDGSVAHVGKTQSPSIRTSDIPSRSSFSSKSSQHRTPAASQQEAVDKSLPSSPHHTPQPTPLRKGDKPLDKSLPSSPGPTPPRKASHVKSSSSGSIGETAPRKLHRSVMEKNTGSPSPPATATAAASARSASGTSAVHSQDSPSKLRKGKGKEKDLSNSLPSPPSDSPARNTNSIGANGPEYPTQAGTRPERDSTRSSRHSHREKSKERVLVPA